MSRHRDARCASGRHRRPACRASRSSAPTATPPATAWCRCRSPCRCRTTSGPRAPRCSSPRKMGLDPALLVHAKAMGPDFTFFVVYGSRHPPRRPARRRRSSSASTRCSRPRRSTPRSRRGCAASSSSSAPASAPTPTPSASTRSSTSRGSRGRRAWSTTARSRSSTSAPRCSCPTSSTRARAEQADAVLVSQVVTQKDAHIHNTTQMSAAFREAYPAGQVPAARRRRPALRGGLRRQVGVLLFLVDLDYHHAFQFFKVRAVDGKVDRLPKERVRRVLRLLFE